MTVVDVRTVERDDAVHFLFHRLTDGFDPHHGEDLHDVVGVSTNRIDGFLRQDAHQRRTVRFQDPFLMGLLRGRERSDAKQEMRNERFYSCLRKN